MKKEWYIGILLSAFALLVVIQQQVVVPNQEIILEFTSDQLTSTDAQRAITIVTQQLQSIGVENTRISKDLQSGTLKIVYYSNEDISYIRKILSEKQDVIFKHELYNHQDEEGDQYPVSHVDKKYKLGVFEIQNTIDFGVNHANKYIIEVTHKYDGNYPTIIPGVAVLTDADEIHLFPKTAYEIYKNIAIAINNTSYKIPQVRAGPIS